MSQIGTLTALTRTRTVRSDLTPLRRMILDVLVRTGQPLGAYGIIEELAMTTGRRVLPASVYRTLSVLLERGLVTRIESINAYLANTQATGSLADIYFICGQCGEVKVIKAPTLANLIELEAEAFGFRIGKRVLEMQGICHRCQQSGTEHSTRLSTGKKF